MAREPQAAVQQIAKVAFGSGEVAPRLHGRYDYKLHENGLALCEGLVSMDAGGLTRRPPTEFIYPAIDAVSRLISHTIRRRDVNSVADCFIIEIAPLKARFFRNSAILLSAGVPYEIAHPYTAPALQSHRLRWATEGDVVFLTDRKQGLWKLTRRGNIDWISELYILKGGPFLDENIDEAKTISASDKTGTVTLTAHGFTFSANMVGMRFKFRDGDQRVVPLWRSDENDTDSSPLGVGTEVINNDKLYRVVASGYTYANPPVHDEGARKMGKNGAVFEFVRFDFGICKITAVAVGGATATATVETQLPEEFDINYGLTLGGYYPTDLGSSRWAEEAFCDRNDWPDNIGIYDQRLYLFKNNRFYASAAADYNDWTPGKTPDKAFQGLLGSTTGKANDVMWVGPGKVLLIGTSGEEMSIQGATFREGVSSISMRILPATTEGSTPTQAVRAQGNWLHIAADGRRVQEIVYDFQIDDFRSQNRSITAEHITAPGIDKIVWHRDPRRVNWIRRTDGVLIGFTYNVEHEVYGWHRHPVSAGGAVLDMAVMPSPDAKYENLWLKVKRTINGVDKYFIERMLDFFDPAIDTDPTLNPFLNCQSRYDGALASVFSGLDRFANSDVRVVSENGDEGVHHVSAGGVVTLGHQVAHFVAGLGYRSHMRLLPAALKFRDGDAPEGRTRLVKSIILRATGTPGVYAGDISDPDAAELVFRIEGVFGATVPLVTSVEEVPLEAEWTNEDLIDIWTDGPFALEILAADRIVEPGDA